jgi:hypothetical protein
VINFFFFTSETNTYHISYYVESKNQFRAKTKITSVTRRCRPGVGRNLYRRCLSSAILKATNLDYCTSYTQNFEILKSFENFFLNLYKKLVYLELFSELAITWKKVKNLSESAWVEARQLKFCMNMLYKLTHRSILDFGNFWNSLWSFPEKFWLETI